MLNLNGILEVNSIRKINDMTSIRFKDPNIFRTPESLVIHEQRYLNNEELLKICNDQYEEELEEPISSFIPKDIIELCKDTNLVPIQYSSINREVKVLYVPEYEYTKPDIQIYKIIYVPTTLHYYISNYVRVYGNFKELNEITGKEALLMIFEETIRRGVTDLTISNQEEHVIAYYNYKKQKVTSNNIFPKYVMDEIISTVTFDNPMKDRNQNSPHYTSYDIGKDYTCRVTINKTIYGHTLSIRFNSQKVFNQTYEDLNINQEVIDFLRDKENFKQPGLRLIVGETMSGKNHTALAMLKEIVNEGISKVVSIEMPVEIKLPGVEQITNSTVDEYISNIESLIRQNPDFIYITEMGDNIGLHVIKVANTGKKILSTLHSNSVADTISRITDITGLHPNRVIQVLHSIYHQSLVRIDNEVYPCIRFVHFTDDLKLKLYDKPFGEIIDTISKLERGGLKDGLL